MRLKKSNKLIALILIVVSLFSMVSCSGVKVDPEVKNDSLNSSPENVCRGFFQSLYLQDEDMFNACFYEGAIETEDYPDTYGMYQDLLDPELEFLGTKHISTRPCNIDNGYDYDVMKDNINVFNDIDENKITDIQLVNIKVFFRLGDENKSIELYSVVYQAEGEWYFFSIIDTTTRKN